jgi:hypothetical protein
MKSVQSDVFLIHSRETGFTHFKTRDALIDGKIFGMKVTFGVAAKE